MHLSSLSSCEPVPAKEIVPAIHCTKEDPTVNPTKLHISNIPPELIRKILTDLSLYEVNFLRMACKGWRHLIDHKDLIENYCPEISQGEEQPDKSVVYSHSFDFHHFDQASAIGQRIAFFVRYLPQMKEKYPKICFQEINLNHFPSLTPKMLTTLSQSLAKNEIPVQTYHLKSRELPLKNLLKFLTPVSPTHVVTSRFFLDNQTTLKELMDRKIQLSHVNITDNGQNIPAENRLSIETLVQFIQQGGLKSPCSLQFGYCSFPMGKIISALIESKTQVNRLEIINCLCSTQDLVRLIQARGLTSPCQLSFGELYENLQFNKEIFESLTAQKIQLSHLLNYATDFEDYEAFNKFAQNGGLASPFHFDVSDFTLNKKTLKILSKCKIKYLTLCFDSVYNQYEKFDLLLKKGKWSKVCSLELNEVKKPQKVVQSLLTAPFKMNFLDFTLLHLPGQHFAKLFRRLVRAGKFASPCKLQLSNQKGVKPSCLFELAEANVKIQQLDLPTSCQFLEYGIIQLCHAGAFDLPCKISLPHILQKRKAHLVLEALASTQVKKLSLNFENFDPDQFLKLMENNENFKSLQVLRLYLSTDYDQAYDQKLSKAKPNMAILIQKPHFPRPPNPQELNLEEIDWNN